MPEVRYVVDVHEGAWRVSLGDKHFGPYSSLDTAVAAASNAAHKAEAQGYEAFVSIESPPETGEPEAEAEGDRHAA